jgi:hypothetical protein
MTGRGVVTDERSGGSERRHAEELRWAIDHGRAGDKVDYPDPAAAPLGTDDEAGGAAPSSAAVRQAMAAELSRGNESATGDRMRAIPVYIMAGVIVASAAALLALIGFNLR